MRSRVFAAVLTLSLFAAAPALGATYTVTGFGDTNDPQGCGLAIGPDLYQCPTLRDAVLETQRAPDTDGIALAAGTYTLTAGQLSFSETVAIVGAGARSTTIQAAPESRIIELGFGTPTVSLTNLVLTGGDPTSGDGGNVLVGSGSTLGLSVVRVTGGTATNGGGIANAGSLILTNSLVDHNQASNGGGIYNTASLSVVNSTVGVNTASEQGGGILSSGNGPSVSLLSSTIAANTKGGLSLQGGGTASVSASILAANPNGNCTGGLVGSGTQNVESAASCGFNAGTNRVNTDPVLSAGLVNAGGGSDVFTFAADSPAVDYVTPCFTSNDQRGYTRTAGGTCDAGAYEQSGTDPGVVTPTPTPTPEPPTPTPAPPVATPIPTPVATPVVNKSVGAGDVGGKVTRTDPKTKKEIPVKPGDVLPNGTKIDATKGKIEIDPGPPGGDDHAVFYDGEFKISQVKGVITLALTGELDCKKGKANSAAKKPKTRKLWGDGKGKFRTKGEYSAATIRGTRWLTTDACTTTTTKVAEGVVSVDDFGTGKTVVVRKGKTYVARARKR